MTLLFTLCICTHNRADLLAAALESACSQQLSGAEYEVLVVDNRSTDETAAVVQSFRERYHDLRCVLEGELGASSARNRGWREAKGEYLAYLDDDGVAPPGWLAQAAEIVRQHNPPVFGGPFVSYYRTRPPAWYKDAYGSWVPFDEVRLMGPEDGSLCAGNLFIRRSVLEQSGGFLPELGVRGEQGGFAEETELLIRLHRLFPGEYFVYHPGLRIQHLVRPEKWDLCWMARTSFTRGRHSYLAYSSGRHPLQPRHLLGLAGLPLIIAWESSAGVLLRSRKRYPYWQNYYYEVVMGRVSVWGKLVERLSQLWKGAQ